MLNKLKPVIEKLLLPLSGLLKNVHPNIITLFGMVFPVLFFMFLVQQMYILALLVFVFNGADLLDGLMARSQQKVTAFGGFLDSTVDRFSDFTLISAFGFAGLVGWEIIMPLLLMTYLISYIRSRTELAAKGNLVANVGIIERSERLLFVFLTLLVFSLWPNLVIAGYNTVSFGFIILTLLSVYTVGQRVLFAYRNL